MAHQDPSRGGVAFDVAEPASPAWLPLVGLPLVFIGVVLAAVNAPESMGGIGPEPPQAAVQAAVEPTPAPEALPAPMPPPNTAAPAKGG